jgi:hypothetical protein
MPEKRVRIKTSEKLLRAIEDYKAVLARLEAIEALEARGLKPRWDEHVDYSEFEIAKDAIAEVILEQLGLHIVPNPYHSGKANATKTARRF